MRAGQVGPSLIEEPPAGILRPMTMRRLGTLLLCMGCLTACSGDSDGPHSKPIPSGQAQTISITVRGGFISLGSDDLNGRFYASPVPLRLPDGRYEAQVRAVAGESGALQLAVATPAATATLHAVSRG